MLSLQQLDDIIEKEAERDQKSQEKRDLYQSAMTDITIDANDAVSRPKNTIAGMYVGM